MRRSTTAVVAAALALFGLAFASSAWARDPCPGNNSAALLARPGTAAALLGPLEFRPGPVSYFRAASPAVSPAPAVDAGTPTVVDVTYSGFPDEARAAFQYAVDVWKTHLSSPVPITIEAVFQPMPAGVLGGANPSMFVRERTGVGPWYPVGLADAIRGAVLLPGVPDVVAHFSDNPALWYFGTDGVPPPGRFDFATVVLHELGHGLGVTGDFTYDQSGIGSWAAVAGRGMPTIFDSFVADGNGRLVDAYPNNSAALGSALTSNSLIFNGPAATRAAGGPPPVLSPGVWVQGTSVYHLDPARLSGDGPASLMSPSLPPGVAIHDPGPVVEGIMRDLGWPPAPVGPPLSVTVMPGDGQVSVTWSPPAESVPVVSYTVSVTPAGGAPATVPVPAGPAVVSGLANGTTYQISVAATTAVGNGPFSAPVAVTPAGVDPAVAIPQPENSTGAPDPLAAAPEPLATTPPPAPDPAVPSVAPPAAPAEPAAPASRPPGEVTTAAAPTPATDLPAAADPCPTTVEQGETPTVEGEPVAGRQEQAAALRGSLAYTSDGFPWWTCTLAAVLLVIGEMTRRRAGVK